MLFAFVHSIFVFVSIFLCVVLFTVQGKIHEEIESLLCNTNIMVFNVHVHNTRRFYKYKYNIYISLFWCYYSPLRFFFFYKQNIIFKIDILVFVVVRRNVAQNDSDPNDFHTIASLNFFRLKPFLNAFIYISQYYGF